jgi:plastocyanin
MTDKVIHPHLTRHISSALLMSAMLLGVAACGSSTKASTATNAPAAAATTPAAAATTPAAAATTPAAAATTTAAAATTTAAAAATTTAGAAAATGTPVAVSESEFKIDLPSLTMAPGTYTFNIDNTGKFHHNLVIEGPGVDKVVSPTVEAGQKGSITVTLQAGSYEISCGIPTHKGKGMDLTVTVA